MSATPQLGLVSGLPWPAACHTVSRRPVAVVFRIALLVVILACTVAAAPSNAPAARRGPTLALASSAEVSSEGVFLDQILSVRPASPIPHALVSKAPPPGQMASVTRAEVSEWLAAHAPELATTNWSGPDRVRITRRMRSLDETELKSLLRETLQADHVKDRGELEVRLLRPWTAVLVPDEPLSLRIADLPATGPSANFIVRFDLLAGGERAGTWQTAVSARLWRDVPVAQVPLRRGQLLPEADVAMERRDVLALRDAPGRFDLNDASLELIENVPAGQPVLARAVRQRPVVQRGQLVDGVIQDGALVINLKVEALGDGLPGQLVRVRNPRTRREMMGKVLNEQTILLPR